MAVDTEIKRMSAADVLLPYRGWAEPGIAGTSGAEKAAITYTYAGMFDDEPLSKKKGMLLGVGLS